MTRASAAAAGVVALGQRPGERARLQPRGLLGGDGGGDAQPLGVELVALAEPDDQHRREAVGAQQRSSS